MGEGGENAEIVRTIMTLANNLGMEVVAEGIETEDQLAQLRSLKCEFGQGYLFSRPVDTETAKMLVLARAAGQITPLRDDTTILNIIADTTYIN
jgi:EAL domain-containing protein (putative c-di-GMP-specific phosphodiesterase class I)